MSENQTTEALAAVAIERDVRRRAMNNLAASMLDIYGEEVDGTAQLNWTQDDTTFALVRDSQEGGQAYWLHAIDAGGGGRSYDLTFDFADSAEQDTIASALAGESARRMFEAAKARLGDARIFSVRHDDTVAAFENFTDAPHGPFIWVKVGYRPDYVAYDLSAEELRRTTRYGKGAPLAFDAPHEEHIRWMMHALTQETVDPSRPLQFMNSEYGAPTSSEAPIDREDINQITARDIKSIMDDIETWSHDALYLRTRGNIMTAHTIIQVPDYEPTTEATTEIPTAIGLVYDHDTLFVEVFDIASEAKDHTVIKVDMVRRKAYGTIVSPDNSTEGCYGDAAASKVYIYLNLMMEGYDQEDGLELCTPETANLFQFRRLRPDQPDSVQ